MANYRDLLHQAAIDAVGENIELCLSIAESETLQADGCAQKAQPLPVVRASEIETPVYRQSWLIDRLWTYQAVGVIGGSPKSGKTWLALEMAVSVASGCPCFDTFAVASPGPVLLYAAEDSATTLRSRLETLARLHKIDFERLNVHVITIDLLRLDQPEHQDRLESTLHVYKPALLVLDPLVRVHSIDENVAGQVAALLGYLRSLQRKAGTAIALVHHVRKNASPTGNAGYSLRGSGDLYAWLDSFLYLRMHQGQRTLSAEHRSAPAFGPIALKLVQSDPMGPHLTMTTINETQCDSPQADLSGRILMLLSSSPEPQTVDSIRSHLQVRNQRVVETIRNLTAQGKIQRHSKGFAISNH
jgi:RecA-family ATPase